MSFADIHPFCRPKNQEPEVTERILELNGTIAEESWFDDDVTPQLFKDELNSGTGDITVWIKFFFSSAVSSDRAMDCSHLDTHGSRVYFTNSRL